MGIFGCWLIIINNLAYESYTITALRLGYLTNSSSKSSKVADYFSCIFSKFVYILTRIKCCDAMKINIIQKFPENCANGLRDLTLIDESVLVLSALRYSLVPLIKRVIPQITLISKNFVKMKRDVVVRAC